MSNNKVYAVCYNTLYIFEDKEKAKKFFFRCYYSSEGAEQKRYASILIGLDYDDIVSDNVSYKCNDIAIIGKSDNLHIKLNESKDINDTIKFYDEMVNPILDLADEYNINFNINVPFSEFGDDNSLNSFSEFYGKLLKELPVEQIETEEISDGKYEISIYHVADNKITFNVNAWDKIENVIDNIEVICNELQKDNNIEI